MNRVPHPASVQQLKSKATCFGKSDYNYRLYSQQ